jgi:peptide/nickel transport system permease protein
MRSYLIRRLLLLIPTLFIVTITIFAMVRLIPGDIVDRMVLQMAYGGGGTAEDMRERLERELGLDVPWYAQYARWMGGVLQGDLGVSLMGNRQVIKELAARAPVTLELAFLALLVSLITALPVGIYSAIRQDTIGDYVCRTVAITFLSVPVFWMATMVVLYPSRWWGWSPSMRLLRFADDPLGNLVQFGIPALILGMYLSGIIMRMTRTMMLEVLRQDYIRTAWSKGLKERVVMVRHALKNALLPVITIVGIQVPYLIGGAVIIEQIFSLPGIGRFMLESIADREYTLVSGINLLTAIAVVLVNLIIDLSYAYMEPRVRYK